MARMKWISELGGDSIEEETYFVVERNETEH